MSDLRPLERGDGLAARSHRAHERGLGGGQRAEPDDGRPLRQLPRLHGLRHGLPVGRALRPAHRGHAPAGRAPASAHRGRATAAPRPLRDVPVPRPAAREGPAHRRLPALGPRRATAALAAAGPPAARAHALGARAARDAAWRRAASSPPVTLRDAARRLPAVTPARGERRGTVGFLQGCVQRAYFGDVNAATVAVLAAEGFEVHAPRAPRCCGALGLHAGQEEDSLPLAKATIEAFERFDHVVVNAAGCGSAIKDYGHLLRDDPEWRERAEAVASKARDVHELLAAVEPRAPRAPVELKVAYHDACHLAHAQGVRSQPRELLRQIPGLELVEPAEWELCCGSGGIYTLTRPGPAAELGERKADNLIATGADVIAAANPGCTLQIAAHLQRKGRPLEILHPMQLLARSLREP